MYFTNWIVTILIKILKLTLKLKILKVRIKANLFKIILSNIFYFLTSMYLYLSAQDVNEE